MFLVSLVARAARTVANVPRRMSIGPYGLPILAMMQPIARPGIAAGVNTGRTVSASEILNCVAPKESGATA